MHSKALAWVELRLVLTRLLWAFDFVEEAAEPVDIDNFSVMMLIQKEAVKMRVKARNSIKDKTAVNDVFHGVQDQYS